MGSLLAAVLRIILHSYCYCKPVLIEVRKTFGLLKRLKMMHRRFGLYLIDNKKPAEAG
jgi:hypothetical protein